MNKVKTLELQGQSGITALKTAKSKIKFTTSKGIVIVKKSDIHYLKSSSNYTDIKFVDGTKLCCSQTLKSVLARLKSNTFYRAHNSFVVNIEAISGVSPSYNEITLIDGTNIPVSRSKKLELKRKLESWFD